MDKNDWQQTSIFEHTARGTMRITVTLPGGRDGPRLHKHAHTTERITVLIGTMDVLIEGHRIRLSQGMGLSISPGTVHSFSTRGLPSPRVQMEFNPAGAMEPFFRGLAAARERGTPELLAIARLTAQGGDYFLARPPFWLQRLVFRTCLWGARLIGMAR